MKKILSCVLILTLLGAASLWALRGSVDGRTYNWDKNHKGIQNRFGQCQVLRQIMQLPMGIGNLNIVFD